VFKLHGEEALLYDPNPDNDRRVQVLRAAAACPVQAILVDRLDDTEGSGGSGGPQPPSRGWYRQSRAAAGSPSSARPWPGSAPPKACAVRASAGTSPSSAM